jgi:dihydrofolate synthase/folylpolyglutamate synthase
VTGGSQGEIRAWLDAHVNLETGIGVPAGGRQPHAPTRERIQALLALLGSPQLEFPTIHITGTNGKTSTNRIIVELLSALGLTVGSYTSPNLERVNERMSLNGEPIADADLDEVLRAVRLAEDATDVHPSYFDVLTAGAFSWFADVAVDVAVVEVGLGGLWDATNEVDGRVAVVTNVALDHQNYLGPTREDIAREKAGIVKPDSLLVLGERDDDLAQIFLDRRPRDAVRRDVDFGVRDDTLAIGGRLLELYTPRAAYADVVLPLHGAHQADNAAIALMAAEGFVNGALDPEVVADAFSRVRSPGRLEVVRRQPLVLLDGAHNVAGGEALRASLDEAFATGPRTLVVGLLREKEPHEMLAALGLDDVSLLVVCRAPSPRALEPDVVAKAAIDLGFREDRIEVADSVPEAVTAALLSTPEDGQVVITGSLYVVGAARGLLVRSQ